MYEPVPDEGFEPVAGHDAGASASWRREEECLLSALVRDDAGIQKEIESTVLAEAFPTTHETVAITVRNGAVDVRGRTAHSDAQRLLTRIGGLMPQ
ncbi:hypothetical protein V1460_19020 [Streptomyces sp. SCSIO 30461]|uniref:hypothetical protein n=1 Tax=Streptomyces sp. SCSIO 30461 TaxID=3118085 RepID=UPI0030CC8905